MPHPIPSIKNVVFDIGNVIIQWQPYEALKSIFPDPEAMHRTLIEIGFFEWNIEQDRGRSWEDGLALIAETQPEYLHIFEAYLRNLDTAHSKQVDGIKHIVEKLHANAMDLYGLSNISNEAYQHVLTAAPHLNLLQHATISAEVGMVKPDRDIFEYCLRHDNLDPVETLFIDDSLANCKSAVACGMKAHLFKNAENLAQELIELGLY
ncbi:MAG: HAD family phosphatase [Rhizobiaceae bacterium]|nr:HAD family phosphatase [Rhizobiaceae bacterium]